jgi:DNA adenine methylase
MNIDPTITRPVLRYHGGKWRLAPWIISFFPKHHTYVEAYGGAGSVLLRKPRCYAEVYNDLDGEIVSLFRVLRNPAQARELERQLKLTPFAREEFELTYFPDPDPIEQARRTILRAFAGFGSNAMNTQKPTGFRSCTTRTGRAPAGDWMAYPDLVAEFTERLRGVVIENRPALDVIQKHDAADALLYIDPPYPHSTRKKKQCRNYRYEMNDQDHRDLAGVLHQASGFVILSGYNCELYEELYGGGGWVRVDKATHADGAQDRIESLWLNPRASVNQQQPLLMEAAAAG